MNNFLAHTDEIRQTMLGEIGLSSIDELFSLISKEVRSDIKLTSGISELKAQKELKKLSKKNEIDFVSFLGGGVYNRFIPAAIGEITRRFEFNTAYTPYQPEISQGTLQMIYEFQTMICELTGMDVSNASVYDGATACAEAVAMAVKIKKKSKILVSDALNPDYKKVVETYCHDAGTVIEYAKVVDGKTLLDGDLSEYAAVLLQIPNYYGVIENIEELEARKGTALLIACVDPMSLSVLKTPCSYGVDIAVGDFQQLGLSMSCGGPHGGFMAAKSAYARQLPGRIVGMTVDKEGKRAFTLTLQAREQHIRREKATSNICTNNSLMALSATVYMSLLGFEGMKEVELLSVQRAHQLAEDLEKIDGLGILYKDFLNEFVLNTNGMSERILSHLKRSGIFGGIRLDENNILVAVTEMVEPESLELYVSKVKELF